MESVEASGKSIEDAILQALARLGRNRDEVDITVLQEPSRGARGIGSREARVRVYLKPNRIARPMPAGALTSPDAPDLADEPYEDEESGPYPDDDQDDQNDNQTRYPPAPNPYNAPPNLIDPYNARPTASDPYRSSPYNAVPSAPRPEEYLEYDEFSEFPPDDAPAEAEPITTAPLRELLPADASIEEFAVATLRVILGHMQVRADVEVVEPENDEDPVMLNIRSQDPTTLSLLIGRRGETLSALQLLVSLIVSKQAGARERVLIDAESYRERREHNLQAMAERVAQQVRRSGHPVALEAMPPNERRIIHMALADAPDISTESAGEGEQRHIVVALKRPIRAPQ